MRVAKSLIGNVAGGNAYSAAPIGYDVNTVVSTFMNNLRTGNFTTTAVNSEAFGIGRTLSSATKSIAGDTGINTLIASQSALERGRIQSASENATSNGLLNTQVFSLPDLLARSEAFSDNASIRVFKKGNIVIDGKLDLIGVRTVIVEE